MKLSILVVIFTSLFTLTSHARMEKYPAEQGNKYVTILSNAGKDQFNYKQFKQALASLAAKGYVADLAQTNFLAEEVQQQTSNNKGLRDWMDFAIQINFSSKVITRNGARYSLTPFLQAHGTFQEICDAQDSNCAAPTEVEFTSYELGWMERPASLGGGTSSAGTK